VAIPGTGIALSYLCYFKFTAYLFLLIGYPIVSFFSALKAAYDAVMEPKPAYEGRTYLGLWLAMIAHAYRKQLLNPKDWFSYWQLNCRFTSYQSLVTQSRGFTLENKWTFLQEGRAKGVPVSPYMVNVRELVVKDRNEEGGMGIYFYPNAAHGGDWILQERLYNADCIARILPSNAPLSTLRVMTGSRLFFPEGSLRSFDRNPGPSLAQRDSDDEEDQKEMDFWRSKLEGKSHMS
jgi:hypothetical protein